MTDTRIFWKFFIAVYAILFSLGGVVKLPAQSSDANDLHLAKAAASGDLTAIRSLLSRGVSPDSGEALAWAANKGQFDAATLLINRGADINLGAPLIQAAANYHWDIVEFLLEHRADPSRRARLKKDNPGEGFHTYGKIPQTFSLMEIVIYENFSLPSTYLMNNHKSNPKFLGSLQAESNISSGGQLAIHGDYIYVTGGGGFITVKITNPDQPEIAAFVKVPEASGDARIAIEGNTLCYGDKIYGSYQIVIFDISDPEESVPVSSIFTTQYIQAIELYENILYVITNDKKLQVYNVANPFSPREIHTEQLSIFPSSMVRHGDSLYVSSRWDGIIKYSISRPTQPKSVKVYNSFRQYHEGLTIQNNIMVAGTFYGLWIVDTNTGEFLARYGGFRSHAFASGGGYIFVGNRFGIIVYQLMGNELIEVGFAPIQGIVSDLIYSEGFLYASSSEKALEIYEVPTPAAP